MAGTVLVTGGFGLVGWDVDTTLVQADRRPEVAGLQLAVDRVQPVRLQCGVQDLGLQAGTAEHLLPAIRSVGAHQLSEGSAWRSRPTPEC